MRKYEIDYSVIKDEDKSFDIITFKTQREKSPTIIEAKYIDKYGGIRKRDDEQEIRIYIEDYYDNDYPNEKIEIKYNKLN